MDKAYFKSRSDMPYSFNGSVMIFSQNGFQIVIDLCLSMIHIFRTLIQQNKNTEGKSI